MTIQDELEKQFNEFFTGLMHGEGAKTCLERDVLRYVRAEMKDGWFIYQPWETERKPNDDAKGEE